MTDIEELYERYVKIYEEADELKEELKEGFLKDEMEELFNSLDIDYLTTWTKEDMVDEFISHDFYSKIKDELEEKHKVDIKFVKKEEPGFSPSKILEALYMEESHYIKKFWENLQKEIDKGLKIFESSPKKHWEELESEWKERSEKLRKNIEGLSETKIPQKEVDQLTQEWKEAMEEMNEHLKSIPKEVEERKTNIMKILKDYAQRSKNIIGDPGEKLRKLYPLWFDMVKEVREELETGRDNIEKEEEELRKTWDKLSKDITQQLNKIKKNYDKALGEVPRMWRSLSNDIDRRMKELPERYLDVYESIWMDLGRKKPSVTKKLKELKERAEEYQPIVDSVLESAKTTYKKLTKTESEEIEELKRRIEELEKKLEE